MNHCTRAEQEPLSGPSLSGPYAQLGFFASKAIASKPSKLAAKTADRFQNRSTKRRVGTEHIADGLSLGWHAAIRAANDPVEFRRKPWRPSPSPQRLDRPAYSEDGLVLKSTGDLGEPAGSRDRVVVEKRDDVAAGEPNAYIPGVREPGLLAVAGDDDFREDLLHALRERIVVVDDDDYFACWWALL
jgi:hypothetical protein